MLQPQVVMVVVITSTGGVTKRIVAFDEPVDPGLADWASEYLNERVAGLQLGTTSLRRRFEDPALSARERAFLAALRPAFTDARSSAASSGSTSAAPPACSARCASEELEACQRLLELLERRAALLELLGDALDPRRPFVRVGHELEDPALHDVALVGATLRPRAPHARRGQPARAVRMDYEKAIRSVRAAAFELSRFVEEVYEES